MWTAGNRGSVGKGSEAVLDSAAQGIKVWGSGFGDQGLGIVTAEGEDMEAAAALLLQLA
jgi:hypothetical protein